MDSFCSAYIEMTSTCRGHCLCRAQNADVAQLWDAYMGLDVAAQQRTVSCGKGRRLWFRGCSDSNRAEAQKKKEKKGR